MDDDNDHRRFSTPATDANFKPGSHSLQQQTLTRSHSAPDARYDFTRHDVGGSIGNGNGNGFNSPPRGFQHELELGRRYRHHHHQQQQQQQFYHRHHQQPLHQHRELLHQYRHARQQQQQSLRHSAAASPPQAPGSLVELLRSHYSPGLELSFGGTRGDGGGGEGGVDDGGGGRTSSGGAAGIFVVGGSDGGAFNTRGLNGPFALPSPRSITSSNNTSTRTNSVDTSSSSSNNDRNKNTARLGPLNQQSYAMEDGSADHSSSLPSPSPVATRLQRARAARKATSSAGDVSTTDAAETATRTGATAASSANGKRPRYLREADRRDIIHRIDRGEKQAALAKEFGVTRAAICHINKNRVEILARSNRADVHAAARHPKRGLSTHVQTSVQGSSPTSAATAALSRARHDRQFPVHEVRSQAMLVLMTTLRRRETQAQEFQVCTERAFRLLLEEALARVPLRVVDVVTPTSSACEGVTTDRASCGVSISEDGFALLQVFRFIQPTSPSGYITLNAAAVRDGVSSDPTLQKVCVPLDLRTYDVFLMEVTCAMGAGACVAIQALLDYGADETTIYFVCLLASAPAVAEIVSRFPAAHIVVGAVDPEVGDDGAICPGFGSFSERYFDSTVVHDSVMGVSADL